MDVIPPSAEVELIQSDGKSVRYISARIVAAAGDQIFLKPLPPAHGPGSSRDVRMQLGAADGGLVTVDRRHVRPVPPAAAGTCTSSVCLDARQGNAWVAVLALGPAINGARHVIYEATLEPGLVRVEDLRPGLDCIPEGPAAGWVPRAPCDASSAIKQRWVSMDALDYTGTWWLDQASGEGRLWRANTPNKNVRELSTSPHKAEAARWWDAWRDAQDQRNLEEEGIPLPTIRTRNFDDDTWRLAAHHLGLPLDKVYEVALGPKTRPSSKSPAPPRHPAGVQGGAAGGSKRGSLASEEPPANKRQCGCPAGPGREAAPSSQQPSTLSQGHLPSSGHIRDQHSPAAAAVVGGTGSGAGAAAGVQGQGFTAASGPGCSGEDEDEACMSDMLASLADDKGGSSGGDLQHPVSSAQLPPRPPWQPPLPSAAGAPVLMQQASKSMTGAVAGVAGRGGAAGSMVPNHDGTRPAVAPAAGSGGQLQGVEAARPSSSQGSHGTPAAPSRRSQHDASAAAVAAAAAAVGVGTEAGTAAGTGKVLGTFPVMDLAAVPGAAGYGVYAAATAMHPVTSGAVGQQSGAAMPAPASAGGYQGGLYLPPGASPAAPAVGSAPHHYSYLYLQQQQQKLEAAAMAAAMAAAAAAAAAAGGVGAAGGLVPGPGGAWQAVAPAAAEGLQMPGGQGAAAQGGGALNSSSQRSHGTPAAPSGHAQGYAVGGAGGGTGAAAGTGQVRQTFPVVGLAAVPGAAGCGADAAAAAMHPVTSGAVVPQGGAAMPAPAPATGGYQSGLCLPPPVAPGAPTEGFAPQQYGQYYPQQQEEDAAAARPAAAGADARPARGEEVPPELFSVLQLHVPHAGIWQLLPDKTLGWGGQAVVLRVRPAFLSDAGLGLCMLPGQGGAQQGGVMGGQLSIDWDRVLTSCYDQVPTSLGGNGIAAAAQQPPYYALKVALPWEWEGEKGSPGWMVARHNHLKRCGSALLDEYHLLNKASGCDGIVRCHAMGFVKVDAFDVPLPALLLEYCAGGSLASRLWPAPPPPVEGAGQQQQGSCKRPGQPMTEEEARRYIIAVCNTVCYLHSMRIAHLDLKASNVLMSVDPDGTEHIKLADLGLAWDFSSSTAMSKHVYTPSHMAPELAEAGSWMRVEVDVWCVGLLILETRFAAEPFGYLFDREGLTAEERQRRRCPAELDNLDSDYYGRLGPLEKAVVRDCLRPLNTRPPLRELVKAHREYFGLSDDGP